MTLELYYHPLASFCWKVLIGLYEMETPFEPIFIDLGDPSSRQRLQALWPFGKFPVLRDLDLDHDRVIPESTIILEYLAQHHAGGTELMPRDPSRALETRLEDRFYDSY